MNAPSTPQELAATYRAEARRLLRDTEQHAGMDWRPGDALDRRIEQIVVLVTRAEQLEREGR